MYGNPTEAVREGGSWRGREGTGEGEREGYVDGYMGCMNGRMHGYMNYSDGLIG